jgi:hypothetical protein
MAQLLASLRSLYNIVNVNYRTQSDEHASDHKQRICASNADLDSAHKAHDAKRNRYHSADKTVS